MSNTARKIKRKQDLEAQKNAELTDEQKKLPTGRLVTAPLRGRYQTLPLLGWTAIRRENDGTVTTPLVMLALALLDEEGMKGCMHVELPVYKGETDQPIVGCLQRYGWQGGVWQLGDEGWPTGDPENEEQLDFLIKDTPGLKASLTFPPSEEGIAVQEVEVGRARGDFLMPPLPIPDKEPPKELMDKLFEVCDDYKRFYEDDVIPDKDKSN